MQSQQVVPVIVETKVSSEITQKLKQMVTLSDSPYGEAKAASQKILGIQQWSILSPSRIKIQVDSSSKVAFLKPDSFDESFLNFLKKYPGSQKIFENAVSEILPDIGKVLDQKMENQEHAVDISILAYNPSFEQNWAGRWHQDTTDSGFSICPAVNIIYFGHQNTTAQLAFRRKTSLHEEESFYQKDTYSGYSVTFNNSSIEHRVQNLSSTSENKEEAPERYLFFTRYVGPYSLWDIRPRERLYGSGPFSAWVPLVSVDEEKRGPLNSSSSRSSQTSTSSSSRLEREKESITKNPSAFTPKIGKIQKNIQNDNQDMPTNSLETEKEKTKILPT